MKKHEAPLVSFVIPCHNEEANIRFIYDKVLSVASRLKYEMVFVDDGSSDKTSAAVLEIAHRDKCVSLIQFSRNFGKEAATSAGIHYSRGDAIIMLDADGQHPVDLVPEFIERWQSGSKVVIGIRKSNHGEGFIKKYGSILFYKLFNKLAHTKLIPGSTDFRLIDRQVRAEFMKLPEVNRITRGLIDWVGFKKDYIEFYANPRVHGEATYTIRKLMKLALNSFVSLSFTPLFIMGYVGLLMCTLSVIIGITVIIESLIMNDPFGWNVTGSGYLGILTIFLIGCILISQGLMSLYISHIYQESQRRPLYVVGKAHPGSKYEK